MRIRRSRACAVLLTLVVFHFIVFTILRYHQFDPRANSDGNRSALFGLWFMAPIMALFRRLPSYSFDNWAVNLVANYLMNEDDTLTSHRLAVMALMRPKISIDDPELQAKDELRVPKFMAGQGENPHVLPFDPRFLLTVNLLNLVEGEKSELLDPKNKPPQLKYFHWADWTDLSVVHDEFFKSEDDKLDCRSFNRQGRPSRQGGVFSPDVYCVDDGALQDVLNDKNLPISKPHIEALLRQPRRAKVHVHSSPGRLRQVQKALQLALYLNDFAPPPFHIVFLVPTGGQNVAPFKVEVDQSIQNRIPIVDSPYGLAVAALHEKVLLTAAVAQFRKLMPDDEPLRFQETKTLQHQDFLENSEAIIAELDAKTDLSVADQNYLDSLKLSVRTRHPTKYFFEAHLLNSEKNWGLGGHYDWRFFKKLQTSPETHAAALYSLLAAWLRFTHAHSLTTWLAHGLLLSWYWSGLMFPWDSDIDVQMPVVDLHRLAQGFNQTIVVDFGPESGGEVRLGRYFMDCGTWISERTNANGNNNIDARFIDIDTGLYIDITALAVSNSVASARYDPLLPAELVRVPLNERPADDKELARNNAIKVYNCANKHFTLLAELSPLRLTYMEGVPALVPREFDSILSAEYKESSITSKIFRAHVFLSRLRLWVSASSFDQHIKAEGGLNQLDLGADAWAAANTFDDIQWFSVTDKEYLEIFAKDSNLLMEYMVLRDATAVHEREMADLKRGKDPKLLQNGHVKFDFPTLRRDASTVRRVMENAVFDDQVQGWVEKAKLAN